MATLDVDNVSVIFPAGQFSGAVSALKDVRLSIQPGEFVVALGASIGGRPHHRIGDRYQDLKELGGTDAV